MQRAYWSTDYAEAYVVEAMLRAHGVQAWVFDALLVRQDWFKTLGFGGYRVMVADEDAPRAADLIGEYRAGTIAVADDAVERPACPRCATPGRDDPAPYRRVFALLIAADAFLVMMFMLAPDGSEELLAPVLVGSLIVAPILAIVFTRYLKGRYACPQCATRWRTLPVPFATMTREVDAATDAAGAVRGDTIP